MGNLSTYLLLAIGLIFIVQLSTGGFDGPFTRALDFDPLLAFSQPWRFVTCIFLHGGLLHLVFNAYALLMFGTVLESRVSSRDYLIIFFGAGIIGSLLYFLTYAFGIIPPIPALGASGAIYGILGAVAMVLPDLRIFFWFIPMRMREAAILWFILELLGSFDTSSGVASAAHVGGLIFGLAYGWYLKNNAPPVYSVYETRPVPPEW